MVKYINTDGMITAIEQQANDARLTKTVVESIFSMPFFPVYFIWRIIADITTPTKYDILTTLK